MNVVTQAPNIWERYRMALDAVTDPDRLERIAGRLLQAADWDDLLTTP